jgi:hypothetical protein
MMENNESKEGLISRFILKPMLRFAKVKISGHFLMPTLSWHSQLMVQYYLCATPLLVEACNVSAKRTHAMLT